MHKHYEAKIVSSNELDRLIAAVEAHDDEGVVLEEVDYSADDEAVDSSLWNHLELCCCHEHHNVPSPDPADLIEAIDALGLTLATIFSAEGREDKVVVIDGQAETDALVWAMLSYLPDWATSRCRNLIGDHPTAEFLPVR